MGEIQNYKDLKAWQTAMDWALTAYRVTAGFPREEIYGLRQQIRRAAVSVPSNIAEGYGRGSRADYVRFLRIARGSLLELETEMVIAAELDYVDSSSAAEFEVARSAAASLLQGLLRSLT